MKYLMAFIFLLISSNSYADLHKWVDADGNVHYSDIAPPPGVQAETIHSSSPAIPASPPPSSKSIYEEAADINKANKAKDDAAKSEADKQEEAKVKQQNCEQARNRLMTLQNAPRIATYDEEGNRGVMDDAARQKNIDEASAAVSKYCN